MPPRWPGWPGTVRPPSPGRRRPDRRRRQMRRPSRQPPRRQRGQRRSRPRRQPRPSRNLRRRPRRKRRRGGDNDAAARIVGPGGRQHGEQPRDPYGDQRAGGPCEAADRQPHSDQQPPRPLTGRQGLVHPRHRLRPGQGVEADAGNELLLRRGGRQAGPGQAGPRQPRPGHRHAEERRHPATAWCRASNGRTLSTSPGSGRRTRISSGAPAAVS